MTTTPERLASFRAAAGSPVTLSVEVCEALHRAVLEFAPDRILELGPTDGVATLVLLEAAAELGATVTLVGSDAEDAWRLELAPRAERVPEHPALEVGFADPAALEPQPGSRVLLWWGAPSPHDAELLLARLPDALAGSTNLLLAPCLGADPADARRYRGSFGERLLWAHGMLVSWALALLLDFLGRNGIEPKAREGGHLLATTVPAEPSAPSSPPAEHDGVFRSYLAARRGTPRFELDYLGVRTRSEFFTTAASAGFLVRTSPALPRFDEEYPEWIDVLEAVERASGHFTMVELGAGWGRWLARGGTAARLRGLPFTLVGVEAEPTHFAWLRAHLEDNNLIGSARLIEAAVAAGDGWVRFHVGDPESWYGQAIDPHEPQFEPRRRFGGRGPQRAAGARERDVVRVEAVSLAGVLAPLGAVDLIDADIQGAEADVFEAARDALAAKVKLVHVGTHSEDNEERLRALFTELGWRKRFDFACLGERSTPWGPIEFQDGVQSWENPAFL